MFNVVALLITEGFWGFLIIIIVHYTPQNPILIIKAATLPLRAGFLTVFPILEPALRAMQWCDFDLRPWAETISLAFSRSFTRANANMISRYGHKP